MLPYVYQQELDIQTSALEKKFNKRIDEILDKVVNECRSQLFRMDQRQVEAEIHIKNQDKTILYLKTELQSLRAKVEISESLRRLGSTRVGQLGVDLESTAAAVLDSQNKISNLEAVSDKVFIFQ